MIQHAISTQTRDVRALQQQWDCASGTYFGAVTLYRYTTNTRCGERFVDEVGLGIPATCTEDDSKVTCEACLRALAHVVIMHARQKGPLPNE